ncbi:unnamed protein product [Acanthoscelides obtectus]|uniref:Uncharacterized protein n=1 Tax=Acanthoscelides obtectus TaxID=200917 RepID=A0A9P0NUL1_ACAOB|nr:unnamed protein product [Acanthoscelides obtectus]CAK1673779.1 hypothetical protein AOBTE_LOCUS29436 [Acanthoscelides obtectus]
MDHNGHQQKPELNISNNLFLCCNCCKISVLGIPYKILKSQPCYVLFLQKLLNPSCFKLQSPLRYVSESNSFETNSSSVIQGKRY